MRNLWFVNGRDMGADFGAILTRVNGLTTWRAALLEEALLGRAGVVRSIGNLTLSGKDLVLEVTFQGSSFAQLKSRMVEFSRWVRVGELHELEFSFFSGSVVYGVLRAPEGLDPADPQGANRFSKTGTLTFLLHAPLWYEKNAQAYTGVVGQAVQPLLGSFSSTPLIRIYHPSGVTNPSFSLYRANGSLIKTVPLTVTLGTDDYVDMDTDVMSVSSVMNGVSSDTPNIAPAGDPFVILDPSDGDPINNSFPYLVGTNCYLDVFVRRLWTTPR